MPKTKLKPKGLRSSYWFSYPRSFRNMMSMQSWIRIASKVNNKPDYQVNRHIRRHHGSGNCVCD